MKLFGSSEEREFYETMADLYSIFIATENLEKGYIRDIFNHEECGGSDRDTHSRCRYTVACSKLISQYKTSVNALGIEFDVRQFIKTYDVRPAAIRVLTVQIKCPAAVHRLIEIGVPATTEHTAASQGHGNVTKHVAETVQVGLWRGPAQT